MRHVERHWVHRTGWLRAAVLGANDGIISIASLIIGVATAGSSHANILVAGGLALIAGAMSMAAGEYVSVSSQADTEKADLKREAHELATNVEHERQELTNIYIHRGLTASLAEQVACQMMEHDALQAHARDELGILINQRARPLQAAWVSATSFSLGAAMPLLAVFLLQHDSHLAIHIAIVALCCLSILGYLGAGAGGACVFRGMLRVTFWGVLAMSITAGIGALFGVYI